MSQFPIPNSIEHTNKSRSATKSEKGEPSRTEGDKSGRAGNEEWLGFLDNKSRRRNWTEIGVRVTGIGVKDTEIGER